MSEVPLYKTFANSVRSDGTAPIAIEKGRMLWTEVCPAAPPLCDQTRGALRTFGITLER